MADPAPLLCARDIGFGYDRQPVLAGINLTVNAGELVCILGPNGCGKTTLLKILLGALQPQQGEVMVQGRPLTQLSARVRGQTLSYVPQDTDVAFTYPVHALVAMARWPWRPDTWWSDWGMLQTQDEAIITEALQQTHLDTLARRSFQTLSGGEQQRVLWARAVAQTTPVMLLDEPVSNMDPKQQVHLLDGLQHWVRAGGAACLVCHDLNIAANWGTRVIFMQAGRIILDAPPAVALCEAPIAATYGVKPTFSGITFTTEES
ncbi:MAG: ABC transporter ATP-binding protein [Phycisphaerae bacterium]